jgi:5-methylcytosine-specific restriction endonuclease McrA
MATANCIVCKRKVQIRSRRLKTFKFCSFKCRGIWRSKYWVGENNPLYQPGPRVKNCEHCGKVFAKGKTEAISVFRSRKFCSMECTKQGQKRLSGERHPLFRADSRRNNRRGKHGAWARAVISRDHATCQRCRATGIQLHAHHVKSFRSHPELRWELSNGLTLCHQCHWAEHAALNANGVNSGKILPGNAGDNPEPSFGRKPIEGVTTRGRAYRRWEGSCEWCGAFVSKTWSDVAGKAHIFCSRVCAGKFKAANRTYRRCKNLPSGYGSKASTSAPRESDEIV